MYEDKSSQLYLCPVVLWAQTCDITCAVDPMEDGDRVTHTHTHIHTDTVSPFTFFLPVWGLVIFDVRLVMYVF